MSTLHYLESYFRIKRVLKTSKRTCTGVLCRVPGVLLDDGPAPVNPLLLSGTRGPPQYRFDGMG